MASPEHVPEPENPAPGSDPEVAQKEVRAVEHLHEAPEHIPRAEPIERSPHAPELNTRAAEYDAQAPEVVPQKQAYELGEYKDATYIEAADGDAPKQKKLFGLRRRTAYILIAVIILVILGAVLGGVLGTQASGNSKPAGESSSLASATASSAASTTASASSTPTPTALSIIEARFGTQDVTTTAKSKMPTGNDLSIDMSFAWGNPDPWVSNTKCLAMLYSFGASIRTFVACESDQTYTIKPDDPGSNSREIMRRKSPDADFTIVSVIWGSEEITFQSVYDALYDYKAKGEEVPFTNDLFSGSDTLKGAGKSAVVWYTLDNYKTFQSLNGKENESAAFEV